MPTEDCGDFFVVDVMLDGKGPWPMVLDSGAATTNVSSVVTRAIGNRKRAHTLEIGPYKATGKIALKQRSMNQLSDALGRRIEGIVGHPVFRPVLLIYDYPGRQVRVTRGELDAGLPGVVNTSRGKRPFVRASIGDHEFTILIDTGSGRGITLKEPVGDSAFAEALRPTGARVRIDGLHLVHTGRLAGNMQLGAIVLERPLVNDSVSVDLVGQEVLRQFVLTFDQRHARMRFDAGERPLRVEFPPLFGMGLAFSADEKSWSVVKVFAGSAAEEAGIAVGDQVIAIDGQSIEDRGCRSDSTYDSEPRDVALTLRRRGRDETITIRTTMLVP